jgi:hypothetical protein
MPWKRSSTIGFWAKIYTPSSPSAVFIAVSADVNYICTRQWFKSSNIKTYLQPSRTYHPPATIIGTRVYFSLEAFRCIPPHHTNIHINKIEPSVWKAFCTFYARKFAAVFRSLHPRRLFCFIWFSGEKLWVLFRNFLKKANI